MVIADQLDALIAGSIDVGILRPPVDDTRLASLRFTREDFVVALPPGHALSDRPVLAIRDLAGVPLVGYPRGHRAGFRERTEAMFSAAGITSRIVHEATQVHTICGLVGSGVGAAIVPEGAKVLAIEGVQFVPIKDHKLCTEIWLAWQENSISRQLRNFICIARDHAMRT
jgi:DNA-binding transcriptional LysR family regulator